MHIFFILLHGWEVSQAFWYLQIKFVAALASCQEFIKCYVSAILAYLFVLSILILWVIREKKARLHMVPPQSFGEILLCSPAATGAHWHINAIRVTAVSHWRSACTTQTNRERGTPRQPVREPGRQAEMKQIKWQDSVAEFSPASVQ